MDCNIPSGSRTGQGSSTLWWVWTEHLAGPQHPLELSLEVTHIWTVLGTSWQHKVWALHWLHYCTTHSRHSTIKSPTLWEKDTRPDDVITKEVVVWRLWNMIISVIIALRTSGKMETGAVTMSVTAYLRVCSSASAANDQLLELGSRASSISM